ncbi:hypothetical protein DSM112329_05452 [Paraconexibacter sp. AEG42_29]|uniref:DUF4126 domain-containing protein n=1 Tax=Paraconexibacter sp. AEG42_29 TaxID=2997339 RepID=A0AAU7B3M6_9ACTN
MNLLLDILQAAGVAAAIGVRPFLPALLLGVLAAANLGVDFDGTDFAFLESPVFIGAMAGAFVASIAGRKALEDGSGALFITGFGAILAALAFAGQLDDRFDVWWPGLLAGPLLAVLATFAVSGLFGRVRARLDASTQATLPYYAEGIALALAGLSVAAPPVGLVGVVGAVVLMRGGKRREGEKYAGLRILR